MTSKFLQAKNEKLLKELARLPENKKCAFCTCMGTQYTCQPPSIYICQTCAGVVRNFPGYRVKSCTMATYTAEEVQKMKQGGNKLFSEIYMAKWNRAAFPPPSDRDAKKVESFIRQILVEKNFYSEIPIHDKSQSTANTNKDNLNMANENIYKTTNKTHVTRASGQNSWASFPSSELAAAAVIPPRSHSFNNEETNVVKSDGQWATFDNTTTTSTNTNTGLAPLPTYHHKAETISEFPMSINMRDKQEDLSISNTFKMSTEVQSPAVHSNASDGPFAKSLQKKQWDPFITSNDSFGSVNATQSNIKQSNLPTGWSTFENNNINDSSGSIQSIGACGINVTALNSGNGAPDPNPQITGGSGGAASNGKDSSLDLDLNNTASPRTQKTKPVMKQPLPENLFTMPEFEAVDPSANYKNSYIHGNVNSTVTASAGVHHLYSNSQLSHHHHHHASINAKKSHSSSNMDLYANHHHTNISNFNPNSFYQSYPNQQQQQQQHTAPLNYQSQQYQSFHQNHSFLQPHQSHQSQSSYNMYQNMPQSNNAYIQAQIPSNFQQQASIQNQYQNPWMSAPATTVMEPTTNQNTIMFSPTRNEETANPAIFRHLVDDLRSTLPKTRGLTKSNTVSGVVNPRPNSAFNQLNNGENMVNETSTNNVFSHLSQEQIHQQQPTRFNSTASSGNPFA